MSVITMLQVAILLLLIFVIILLLRPQSNSNGAQMYLDHVNQLITWLDSSIRDEFARNREENLRNSKDTREQTLSSLKTFSDILSKSIADNGLVQRDQLSVMIQQLEKIRETVESRLKLLQEAD